MALKFKGLILNIENNKIDLQFAHTLFEELKIVSNCWFRRKKKLLMYCHTN